MASRHLRITFPPDLVTEPIIYELGREFDLVTNIRRANIARDSGWAVVELQGDEETISRAVEWARGRGVTVELLDGNQVE